VHTAPPSTVGSVDFLRHRLFARLLPSEVMKLARICLFGLAATGCVAKGQGIWAGPDGGAAGAAGSGTSGASGAAGASGNSGASGTGGEAAGAGTSSGGSSGSSALPAGCFQGASAECNPLTNAGCSAGEACDAGIDESQAVHLVCYPPPNPQAIGDTCNAQSGPYCAPGGVCTGSPGICVPFCCDDSDCSSGTSCAPIDPAIGTLGGCLQAGTGGAGGSGGASGSGGTSGTGAGGSGGSGGHDLVNCTGSAWSTGSVAGVTPQVKVSSVQTDPSGNVKLILLPKSSVTNGDVVVGVYFFAKQGQYDYPANGGVGCAVMQYQNGWLVLDKTQICEVQLSALSFASQPGTCDGVMVGSFKGIFSSNLPLGGTFSVPLEIAESQVKPPSCQGMNGPCSQHSDCCSKSCSMYIGVCN
jgi:hypothetical protein